MIGSFIAAPFKMLVKVMDGVEKFFTGLPSAISGGFDAFAKHLYESFLAIFITPIKDAIASIFDIDFGKVADTAKGMADKAVGKVKSFFGFGDDDEKKEEPKQQAKTKRAKPKADQDDFNARYEAYLNRQMDEEERRAFGQPESPPPRNAELSNRQLDYMKLQGEVRIPPKISNTSTRCCRRIRPIRQFSCLRKWQACIRLERWQPLQQTRTTNRR